MSRERMPGVWELIRNRMVGTPDDYVLSLALEGGGMRGVVSGAMLIALRDLGIAAVFDRMYGTSSGSINLAYFAAGGDWDALSIYYDHLPYGFVNPVHHLHRPRLNMTYLFDTVMRSRVPLDVNALKHSEVDVRLGLSNVDTARPELIHARQVASDIHQYLMAGAWLPILAGSPYVLNGQRYLDGGLLWPDPLYPALSEGSTHVLMVNTAADEISTENTWATRLLLRRALDHWTPGLGSAALAARGLLAADKALLRTNETVDIRGTSVLRIRPAAGSHRVRRLTLDRADLLDGARAGYEAVFRAFGRPLERTYFAMVDPRRTKD